MTDFYIMVNESEKEFIDPMRVANYSRDRELDFIESSTIFWFLMGAHEKKNLITNIQYIMEDGTVKKFV